MEALAAVFAVMVIIAGPVLVIGGIFVAFTGSLLLGIVLAVTGGLVLFGDPA